MPSIRNKVIKTVLNMIGFKHRMSKDLKRGLVLRQRPSKALRKRHVIGQYKFSDHTVIEISPRNKLSKKIILYLHGGGFVYGLLSVHFPVLAKLADQTACKVVAPCYPLPPESTGEEIRAFTHQFFEGLVAEYGVENIVLMGDSAGGTLAINLLQERIKQGRSIPDSLVLWSPWVDLTMSNPELVESNKREYIIELDSLVLASNRYRGDIDPMDPDVSPFYGDVSQFPATLLVTGTEDLLYPDIVKFADKLDKSEVELTLDENSGLNHYWMFMPQPEATVTLNKTAAFINNV